LLELSIPAAVGVVLVVKAHLILEPLLPQAVQVS
jgi:hypothetical protein